AVVRAVHFGVIVGVTQLDEPAGVGALAANELKRPARQVVVAPAREDAGEVLLAEVEHRHQARVAAKPAAVDRPVAWLGHWSAPLVVACGSTRKPRGRSPRR